MATSPSKWESRMATASHLANLVMAVAVIISAAIAVRELTAIHEQVKSSRQQNGMEILWRLHDRMVSDTMKANLKILGTIPKPTTAEVFTATTAESQVLRDMANFYEMLGLSINRGYIDYDDVRGYIGTDVMEFWEGVDSAILALRRQENRPSMYCELEKLATRLGKDLGYPRAPSAVPATTRAPGEVSERR